MSNNISPDLHSIVRKLENRMLAGEMTPKQWADAVLALVHWANTNLNHKPQPTPFRVIKGGVEQ